MFPDPISDSTISDAATSGAAEVAQWRREQRRLLIARREAIEPATLLAWRNAIDGHLLRSFPGLQGIRLAICWPYRNEYDARHIAALLRRSGTSTLLPVVVARAAPLVFREWHPGVTMEKGPLGILFPRDTAVQSPQVVLLPTVGFDEEGYRLGYGGGYFDRTLASLDPPPVVIGVAHELARLPSIHPQKHDIAMDYVATERGVYRRDQGRLEFLAAPLRGDAPWPRTSTLSSPVCYADAAENRLDR